MSVDAGESSTLSFDLTPGQEAVRQAARSFAEKEMRPVIARYDESQEFPHEIVSALGELGFMGMTWPEELGGAGLSDMEATLVIEEIARVDPSVALTVASHNSLCTGHLMLFGSEEQKRRYVPDLASGRLLGAWGLTEPASGSDSGGMKSAARRDGGAIGGKAGGHVAFRRISLYFAKQRGRRHRRPRRCDHAGPSSRAGLEKPSARS